MLLPLDKDRLAGVFDIKINQLFAVFLSPQEIMERLYQSIVKDIDQAVAEAVERAVFKKT